MNLEEIEREIARLDSIYRPVAKTPVDLARLDSLTDVAAAIEADLARLGVEDEAQAVLSVVIDSYAAGDEAVRALVRQLFDRYPSFRWAAHLPRDGHTAEDFRARLIHLSARDQGDDARDEIMGLQDLCDRARQDGIDVDPILFEVAEMSSSVDRQGMGSLRRIILNYGKRRTG